MAITVISYVFAIVNVPLLPVSPQVVMPFVLLAFCGMQIGSVLTRLSKQPLFLLILLIWAIHVGGKLLSEDLSYELISLTGRTISAAVFVVAIAAYSYKSIVHFSRVQHVVLTALILSAMWFLFEVYWGSPFSDFRASLFTDLYLSDPAYGDTGMALNIRTGLTPFPHNLGYQFSVAAILLIANTFVRRRARMNVMTLVQWGIVLLALQLSSQRSAVLAILVSLLPLLFRPNLLYKHRQRFVLIIIIAAVLIVGVLLFVGLLGRIELATTGYLQASTVSKFLSPEAWKDAGFRLQLQLRAFELLLLYPIGLQAAGLNWDVAGFWHVYGRSKMDWVGAIHEPIAPHNHYLTMSVDRGLFYFLLLMLWLALFLRFAWRMAIFGLRQKTTDTGWLFFGPASAALGLFTAQALTHNGGIISLEPQSLLVLSLLFAATLCRKSAVAGRLTSKSTRRMHFLPYSQLTKASH